MRSLTIALAVVSAATAVALAPSAAAAPQCVNTGPTTTQCDTPGHSQITTSPPAMNDNAWWPYGGIVVGFPW
ncbi:hypothetical protein D8S82_23100 [Mycobacterium hodleri]|uniref:Uncharacterized protein n=1 Tax=Mycolicibacterium hodleri TaxID=49897 RepID=A0A544VW93_9MYCO|nr:hypothetical protein [Mycolicibacterium hodleri]TQR84258.1 hypothetical protein D8S82_23100 [Mycolicibacterium hodleri]